MRNAIKFLPNTITITRMLMSILFASFIFKQFVYSEGSFINLILLFLAICLSDLIDGKLARGIGCTSRIGAKLDVGADLLFIILSYTTLIILKVLQPWFLGFICFKFIEFVITSNVINNNNCSLKKDPLFLIGLEE